MNNNVLHIHIKGFCIFTFKMSVITLQITAASSGWWLYCMFTQKRSRDFIYANYYITVHISFTGIDILHKERDFTVSAYTFP